MNNKANSLIRKYIILWSIYHLRSCQDCNNKDLQACLALSEQLGDDHLGDDFYICKEHAKNYKIVGQWARIWQRDFAVEEK